MRTTPETLQASGHYRFSVTVEDSGHAFAGELTLAPDGCCLVVRGDTTTERHYKLSWDAIDELQCNSFDATFVLIGLVGAGGESRLLQGYPERVGHFEIRYTVDTVIFQPLQIASGDGYLGLSISGPSIDRWVGMTSTQQAIVARSQAGTLFRSTEPVPDEVAVEVPGIGQLFVTYHPTMGRLDDDFTIGLRYPPVFSVTFGRPRSAADAVALVEECQTLLSFLIGHPLTRDSAGLLTPCIGWRKASLYKAHSSKPDALGESRYPVFPLGHNLSHNQMGLPAVPPALFAEYFALSDAVRRLVRKYIRYREFENPEERFLGFFRLLEKLCYKNECYLPEEPFEAFLNRCTRFLRHHFDDKKNVDKLLERVRVANRSKLNTSGCIRRFMETLPAVTTGRWMYGKRDLDAICKLRNDLIHANEVEPEAHDVVRKAKFIEALLVIRLLVELGLPTIDAATVGGRIHQHFLIEKHESRVRPAS